VHLHLLAGGGQLVAGSVERVDFVGQRVQLLLERVDLVGQSGLLPLRDSLLQRRLGFRLLALHLVVPISPSEPLRVARIVKS
jgi:hypothetical protein